MTDPIADMFSRIRNAQAVKKPRILIPHSKIKYSILQLLKESDFIGEIKKFRKKTSRIIEVKLKYEDGVGKISELERISKPSRRLYIKAKDVRPVKRGFGFLILSTPKGIMKSTEARKQNIGGEIIGKVW